MDRDVVNARTLRTRLSTSHAPLLTNRFGTMLSTRVLDQPADGWRWRSLDQASRFRAVAAAP